MDIRLVIISDANPKTDSILRWDKEREAFDSFIKGTGEINYHCGTCDSILCKDIEPGSLKNLVFECPYCGKFNYLD